MKKYLTDPAVYMPAAIVLVTMIVWVMFNGLGPAWERWSHERRMERILVWTPEPWAITVDDFPEGTATALPAQEAWLSRWSRVDAIDPWETPGLEHVIRELPFSSLWVETRGTPDAATWCLNGVRAGDTDVFSFAGALADGTLLDNRASLWSYQTRVTAMDEWYAERTAGVLEHEAIGDTLTYDERSRRIHAGEPFHTGPIGYMGNRVVVVDESGERLEVVGVATVTGDAFVAVGTVTPVGVEPDADAVELLETLAAKVRATT